MRIRMFSKIAVVLCLSMTMNSYDYINNNIVVIAKAETKKMQDDYTGYIIESKSVDMYNKMKANFSGKSENKNYNRSMRKNRLVKTERLSRKRLQSLQSNRDTYIEKDYIVKGADVSWQENINQIVDSKWNVNAVKAEAEQAGDGLVKVAVLDSGTDMTSSEIKKSVNLVDDADTIGIDVTGHGTAVANIIKSDKKSVPTTGVINDNSAIDIYSVKVLDDNNEAPVSRIISAIQWCIDNDINIINMSFGMNSDSKLLHNIIKRAEKKGILLIASAGNSVDAIQVPAAYSEVIAVGSVNENMKVSDFSAKGDEVEIYAPGENIPISEQWGFYTVKSGTSYAAPHVTAIAALLWSDNIHKSSAEIRRLIKISSNKNIENTSADNGVIDYEYASKVSNNIIKENKIEKKRKIDKISFEGVVKAQWSSSDSRNGHPYLITDATNQISETTYSAAEKKVLCKAVSYADNRTDTFGYTNTSGGKTTSPTMSEFRILHAGTYSWPSSVNYVSVARCLYESACKLHSNPNCTNDTLKNYCENKYGNGDDSSTEYKRAVRDLRRVVDIVMKNKIERPADNDIVGLTETRIHELQFVALAIHASTDAFSHQYIVPYSDTKTILANYKFGNITRVNELIAQRTITLKDFEHLITSKGKASASSEKSRFHSEYSDKQAYRKERYNVGALHATKVLLKYFNTGNGSLNYTPLVFVNTNFQYNNTNRIPLNSLSEKVMYAGYSLDNYATVSIEKWQKLSWWK